MTRRYMIVEVWSAILAAEWYLRQVGKEHGA